jgi:hypothetical protein
VFDGAVGGVEEAVTSTVAADCDVADPASFVAVTDDRIVEPTSPDVGM